MLTYQRLIGYTPIYSAILWIIERAAETTFIRHFIIIDAWHGSMFNFFCLCRVWLGSALLGPPHAAGFLQIVPYYADYYGKN
jgi:hypothetical protein